MKKVTVYSTPTCPWCVKVKDFLKANNIEFTDYNVGEDQKMAAEMVQKTGQMGVPVVEIENEIIIGFDERKISELLGIK
ncbi:glutathione S-transferase N-terminal domain-containing protein [Patescibacteria group bacterium]|nr:glutathione S-transferase N-terminal domain-containing protein [Patescibacteria group bacterium]